jgi:hypothetical protein
VRHTDTGVVVLINVDDQALLQVDRAKIVDTINPGEERLLQVGKRHFMRVRGK